MSPDGEETGEEEVKKCQREDEHKARKGPRSLIYFPGGGGKFLKGKDFYLLSTKIVPFPI